MRAAMLACVVLCAWAFVAADEPAPMTNEDVVRLVAAGTPERDIIGQIRNRATAFDTSDEMLEELKTAGVPASVIAEMRARAEKAAPEAPPPERTPVGFVRITVRLPGRTLSAPKWADEETKRRLGLSKEIADREVRDLAVFVVCEEATHVPDQWRSKTPLGRDMNTTKRHEMLAFVAGDTPAGKTPKIKLPDQLEASVDGTEPHDLVLGVAARIGDRWLTLATGKLPHVGFDGKPAALAGEIHALGAFVYEVKLTRAKER